MRLVCRTCRVVIDVKNALTDKPLERINLSNRQQRHLTAAPGTTGTCSGSQVSMVTLAGCGYYVDS